MNITLRNLSYALSASVKSNNGFRTIHRWVRPTLIELKKRKDKLVQEKPNRRNEYLEWNYNAELFAFGKRLDEEFNISLLKNALVEKSYILKEEQRQKDVNIEPNVSVKDNSNMAVDGEKIISSYVKQYLEGTLPNLPRKYLRNIKDYLISEEVLANVSKGIGIDDIVLCAEYPVSKSTLTRALKSVIQALALSQGLDRANRFVRDFISVQIIDQDLTVFCTPENPMKTLKTLLNEIGAEPPEPRLIIATGRNNILANYQVGIYSNKKMLGRGFGENIETARDMAACDALWRKWEILPQKRPFTFKVELPQKLVTGNCQ